MSEFYIYVHKRATDGQPFYYGKGIRRRAWDKRRNAWHNNVVEKHGMVVEIIVGGLTAPVAKMLEITAISFAKSRGEPITNLTNGGDGASGEASAKANETNRRNGTAIYSLTPEARREIGLRAAAYNRANKTGLQGRSKEKVSTDSAKGGSVSGKNHKQNKTGMFAITLDQQPKYACSECGKIGFAGGIALHQMHSKHQGRHKLCAETVFQPQQSLHPVRS